MDVLIEFIRDYAQKHPRIRPSAARRNEGNVRPVLGGRAALQVYGFMTSFRAA